MSLFNSSSINFKEVIVAVTDAVTETKCITEEGPVVLKEVSLVEHQDNIPSIKLKWTNEAGESLFDFRNFSGKTKENLVKQILAHVRLIALLGYCYRQEELTNFDGINALILDMFDKLKSFENRWLAIEVKKDDESGYWNISKYLPVSKHIATEEEVYESEDTPF